MLERVAAWYDFGMIVQTNDRPSWQFSDGRASPIGVGDAIAIKSNAPLVDYHYGIVVEVPVNEFMPIRVAEANKGTGVVIVTIEEFGQGQSILLARRAESQEHVELIRTRAYTLVGKPYNVLSANCEHFAEYCMTGEAKSATVLLWSIIATTALTYGLASA